MSALAEETTAPRRQGRALAFFGVAGALLIVFAWAGGRHYLLAAGYQAPHAIWLALIFAVCLEMIWLPLAALAFAYGRGGWRHFAAFFAGTAATATAFDLYFRGANGEMLWAQTMCLAVALLAIAIFRFAASLGFSPAGGRGLATMILAFLYTNPFWARLALDRIADAAVRNSAVHISVWLAPLPCLSIAFEGFNFATDLGIIYRIWLGPVVPYPPHPLAFVAAYVLAAGIIYSLGWLWPRKN